MTNLNHSAIDIDVDPSLNGVRIPLDQIRRNPKIDPRKGRNKALYAQMKQSVRNQGVLQAILLRPTGDANVPYEVVFGNTRYDISVELELADIPAIVREMTDAEARRAATTENLQRADLTPLEEAYAAVTTLEDENNNHDEACLILGWNRQKLDSRILLSKCCDEVAEALVQGEIKLGHAELLAPMVPEDQRTICSRIIERKMNVAATRERLIQLSGVIANAPFDTTECQTCEHNSSRYGDLFSASVGDAKCQNRTCWDKKTSSLIEVKLIEAKQEYGVVHTDLTLPDGGYVLLEDKGQNGVGVQQFSACTACENYGAVVSTKPGQEGRIVGGHCFNKSCHAEHNKAYKALIQAATAAPAASQGQAAGQSQAPAAASNGAVKEAAGSKPGPTAPAKPQEIKKAIKREAFSLFSQMGVKAIHGNMSYALAISIVSMYLEMRSDLPNELLARMQKVIGLPSTMYGHERANAEAALAMRPVEELQSFLSQLAACTVFRRDISDQFQKSISGAQSLAFIQAAGMDPVDHFKMTESYLKALTKAGVIADCKASGFDVKYDEVKGEKEFAKLTTGKSDELIKAVLAFTEFSWKGYLPEAMKISAYDGSATA
ncbi:MULTISPECIES: PRTRC system ParB family protein [Pseudomonas]|uniref:PRTRC system ParB family protein n=1 Tax=Pseudomonas TaxID=286 RepID=UPI00209BC9B7|nr:PRTRC system ParB family protein [Pseudomonas putida]